MKHVKYLDIKLINKNTNEAIELNPIKIYALNIEYYLTKGANHEKMKLKPFYYYIEKDSYNLEDIIELIDKEDILSKYNIDSFKYYNNEKKVFEDIKNKNIEVKEKNILEFHINGEKNNLINNINWTRKYLNEEIIKIKNKINKILDKVTKYDLIYLYASPIIENENYNESKVPISYSEEIKIIIELMKNKGKQFNCKFECAYEEILRDILVKNKTKILHISEH